MGIFEFLIDTPHHRTAFVAYMSVWCTLTTVTAIYAFNDDRFRSELPLYVKFLLVPWKVMTFLVSGFGVLVL